MGVWPVSSQFTTVDTPSVDGTRALSVTIPVGAGPRLLRHFSAAQAVFIAVPGTVLGVVIGLLPKISWFSDDRSPVRRR
ncbi:hypothetical protein [Corynebacterium sp.]|uniref:hypothetical protein n=1 Tax=Corynebacterium sp. TaxID=1720 RepID=UPI0028AA5A76|nr:hypothetical protein [Corynebacterium sp.]